MSQSNPTGQAPQAGALERLRVHWEAANKAEFFDDGLSADLGEMGIERKEEAYVRGFEDAVELWGESLKVASALSTPSPVPAPVVAALVGALRAHREAWADGRRDKQVETRQKMWDALDALASSPGPHGTPVGGEA